MSDSEALCGATHPNGKTHCRRRPDHDGDHGTARLDVSWPVEPVDDCDHPRKPYCKDCIPEGAAMLEGVTCDNETPDGPCVKWAGHHDPCSARRYEVLAGPGETHHVHDGEWCAKCVEHGAAPSCCELACYEDPGCACDGCKAEDEMTRLRRIEKAAREAMRAGWFTTNDAGDRAAVALRAALRGENDGD